VQGRHACPYFRWHKAIDVGGDYVENNVGHYFLSIPRNLNFVSFTSELLVLSPSE